MSELEGKRAKQDRAHEQGDDVRPVPGKHTQVEQLSGAEAQVPRPSGAPTGISSMLRSAGLGDAHSIEALFGRPPSGLTRDAAEDRGEPSLTALAHDIVEHEALHDKLAHVPDNVLEHLVREVGRSALIRLVRGGDLPVAPAAPDAAEAAPEPQGSAPPAIGLLGRLASEDAEPAEPDERAAAGTVQRRGTGASEHDAASSHAIAQRGIATPPVALPHASTIQRAFGRHDISSIQAHDSPEAAAASAELGADAYATGHHVVVGSRPDLCTMAHEAAHVVQQRAGVHCKGGIGEADDRYEQQADEVASLVVSGQSAEAVLDAHVGASRDAGDRATPPPASASGSAMAVVQRHHKTGPVRGARFAASLGGGGFGGGGFGGGGFGGPQSLRGSTSPGPQSLRGSTSPGTGLFARGGRRAMPLARGPLSGFRNRNVAPVAPRPPAGARPTPAPAPVRASAPPPPTAVAVNAIAGLPARPTGMAVNATGGLPGPTAPQVQSGPDPTSSARAPSKMTFEREAKYLDLDSGPEVVPGYCDTLNEARAYRITVTVGIPVRGVAAYSPDNLEWGGYITVRPISDTALRNKTAEYQEQLIAMAHELRHAIDDLSNKVSFRSDARRAERIQTEWRAFATHATVAWQLAAHGRPVPERYLKDLTSYESRESFTKPGSPMFEVTRSYMQLYRIHASPSDHDVTDFMAAHTDWIDEALQMFQAPATVEAKVALQLRPPAVDESAWRHRLTASGWRGGDATVGRALVCKALRAYFGLPA